ncbi:MAG: RDD family protein [Pseudomonadota bacterium]
MNEKKTNTLRIVTPEGVVFSLLLAGPVTRFLAWLIDLFCIMLIAKVATTVLSAFFIFSADLKTAAIMLSYFVISIGYSILLEWYLNGQTLGKRLFKLRVMDVNGLRLKPGQIIIRNLLRFVDALPALYMVGGLSVLISKHAQRLGDIAANTIVIRSYEPQKPDFAQIFSDKYNSFRNYPHIGARLRQNTSQVEADIGLQALLRREAMDPVARVELFTQIGYHFKTIAKFPQEATDGLSDEQYTRNAVDILFRYDG